MGAGGKHDSLIKGYIVQLLITVHIWWNNPPFFTKLCSVHIQERQSVGQGHEGKRDTNKVEPRYNNGPQLMLTV